MTELDRAVKEIEARIAELRSEIDRLEIAHAALTNNGGGRATRGRTAARGRPRGAGTSRRTTAKSTGRRRGRPKGSGKRAAQAEKLVRENPGITIAQLAEKMSINPTYLYRVMPQLQSAGKVRKKDKAWHPA